MAVVCHEKLFQYLHGELRNSRSATETRARSSRTNANDCTAKFGDKHSTVGPSTLVNPFLYDTYILCREKLRELARESHYGQG